MGFSACQTKNPSPDLPVIEIVDVNVFRRPMTSETSIQPNYFIEVKWKSEAENPLYKIEVLYSTEDPQNNRAKLYSSDAPDAQLLGPEELAAYSGTSFLLKDYQRDFNGLPDTYSTEVKNEKVYTFRLSFADTAKFGSEVIEYQVVKYLNPISPVVEGDVMIPPPSGGPRR